MEEQSYKYCTKCGVPLASASDAPESLCYECRAGERAASGLLPGEMWIERRKKIGITPQTSSDVRVTRPAEETGSEASPGSPRIWELEGRPKAGPDNPSWGIGAAFGLLVLSFISIVFFQVLIISIWWIAKGPGASLPTDSAAFAKALEDSPQAIFLQILAMFPAHIVTIAACWAVVTGAGSRPFLESIGWRWDARIEARSILLIVVTPLMLHALNVFLVHAIPEVEQTPLDKWVESSSAARWVISILAVFSAPFVEELVFRGIVYPALRRRIGIAASVIIVTIVFAGIHIPQYWGAWATITGLMVVSFTLTLIRALTKSILPGILIHFLFNLIGVIPILLH